MGLDSYGEALVVAAGGATFAGLVWIGRRLLQVLGEARVTLQDWRGTPARPGVDRRPGVLEALHHVKDGLERVDRTLAEHLAYVDQEHEALKMARAVAEARKAGHEEATQLWALMESVADGRVPSAEEEEDSHA